MITESGSITALLKLNTSNFSDGLEHANSLVGKFEKTLINAGKNSVTMESGMVAINDAITTLIPNLTTFNKLTNNVSNFNKFSNAIHKTALAIELLSRDSVDAEMGMTVMNNIMKTWQSTLNGTEVKIKGVTVAQQGLANATNSNISKQQQFTSQLANSRNSANSTIQTLMSMARTLNSNDAHLMTVTNATRQYASALTQPRQSIEQVTASLEKQSLAMRKNAEDILKSMGYTRELSIANEQLAVSEVEVASASGQASASLNRSATSASRGTTAMNSMRSSAGMLSKTLGSLRTMGTLVGSMLAYNFAHKLLVATGETIHAKSEMEGYFKMLNFGRADVDHFNKALDSTVAQFQRVNKYSLGETISSIGVEFNLTTEEMEKAMKVTSMVTSEYLRAGRSANEASLAVKDVLQGQFQRLSRETGVKGEQLKEAGWSGDTTDVLSLMEALEKVGESRNWDVFASKANSLNDIITILQNRFGEWSADMVNVVQPSIVSSFNSIMSFGEGLSKTLSGFWQWLNTDGWGQTATKIGLVSSAILTVMPALTAYRGGINLLQASNLSLGQSLASLVLGINAETFAMKTNTGATLTSSEAIGMRILGISGEEVAEHGLVGAINKTIVARGVETAETELGATANIGFTGGLYAMIAGEALAEGETLSLSGALGILTGAFLTSPIGWFTLAILGLASAFYVLTGGLDEGWAKMQSFNQMVDNASDTMQTYYNHLAKIKQSLDDAKEKYGENSLVVQQLQERYDNASNSVENFNKKLNEATYIKDNATQAYDEIGASIDELTENTLKSQGWTEKQLEDLDSLGYGYDKYYKALQVLHKQVGDPTSGDIGGSNFEKDLKTYADSLKRAGIEGEEATDKIDNFKRTYMELAKNSYDANTAEDWWSWAWSSLYAGMNQMSLDWEQFWTSLWGDVNTGTWLSDEGAERLDTINSWFTDIGNAITNFDIDAWFSDLMSSIGGYDLYGSLMDALFGETVSASDGSSDHPSFMEDLSTILGFDVQTWIDNFIADPLGTLGVPEINVLDSLTSAIFGNSEAQSIDVVDIVNNCITSNADGLMTWVTDNVITPIKEALEEGINNIPVIGDITEFLGLGEDTQAKAEEKGNEVGAGISTGTEQGLVNVPNIVETAFSSFNLDNIVSKFSQNTQSMTTDATTVASDVSSVFSGMKNNVKSSLDSLVSHNSTSFTSIKDKANTSLANMRDSTSSVTGQMTSAWTHMKDSIVASANKIKSDSESRFTSLSTTIGNFYKKIQTPSLWGSGSSSLSSGTPKPRVGKAIANTVFHGAGSSGGVKYSGSNTMTITSLKKMICPNGDCAGIFDGYDDSDIVDVNTFLKNITGEHGFGWDFADSHNKYIKTKSDAWKTGSPVIMGSIPTSTTFKVGEFNNGKPNISFSAFQSMAGSIFSAIPYKHYMDSSWKGNWLSALLSGAVNCSDGADALISFAHACGFSGYKQWGKWGDEGHFWAVINGVPMDTTAWQKGYGWTSPKVHGYGTGGNGGSSGSSESKTINITVDMRNSTIYGVDDLDSRIQEGVKKGLYDNFNDPYGVTI